MGVKQAPKAITLKYLERFPELAQFRGDEKGAGGDERMPEGTVAEAVAIGSATPEEQLEASYVAVRGKLAEDLLERVKSYSPRFFEKLVVDVLVAMGYGGSLKDAGRAVGQSGDGGIDGIIKADRLGLDAIYIQAKRWEATVGRPVVQAFAGSLEGQRARKGVLITTSQFSREARDYVSRIEKKIVLIDGAELAQLMIDYIVHHPHVDFAIVSAVDIPGLTLCGTAALGHADIDLRAIADGDVVRLAFGGVRRGTRCSFDGRSGGGRGYVFCRAVSAGGSRAGQRRPDGADRRSWGDSGS